MIAIAILSVTLLIAAPVAVIGEFVRYQRLNRRLRLQAERDQRQLEDRYWRQPLEEHDLDEAVAHGDLALLSSFLSSEAGCLRELGLQRKPEIVS